MSTTAHLRALIVLLLKDLAYNIKSLYQLSLSYPQTCKQSTEGSWAFITQYIQLKKFKDVMNIHSLLARL